MASRYPLNKASYLMPTSNYGRRLSSSSSISSISSSSATSEDSFVTALKNTTSAVAGGTNSTSSAFAAALSTGPQESSGVARSGLIPGSGTDSHPPTCTRSSTSRHPPTPQEDTSDEATLDTPTIKRSRPIAIELPSSAIAARKKSLPVYTPDEPLSARGDLSGGYFPLHEDPTIRDYKPHPFHHASSESKSGSSFASPSTSMPSSSRDTTPRASNFPEATLAIPMGKYHPSNYKITPVSSPSSSPSTSVANLSMPSPSSQRRQHSSSGKHHKRNPSDVKRKLQQYQRDMIAQSRHASMSTAPSGSGMGPTGLVPKPTSPRLLPMGSPDELSAAMTPLELGGAGEGYLGARSLAGPAEGRESEMVGRMIRMEEERRRREGQSSPVARV